MLCNVGSERAVLSGICQYGEDAYIDCSDILNDNTFTDQFNKHLFRCLQRTFETGIKSIDQTTVVTTASNIGIYDVMFSNKKDIDRLNAYFSFPIKIENVREHAKVIAKLEFARFAQSKMKSGYDDLNQVTGEEDIDDILGICENKVFELVENLNSASEQNTVLITDGSDELLEHLIQNPVENVGIPTPFPLYNREIGGGCRRGGVNLISARSKVGKTTFGANVCLHCVKNLKIPVLVLDSEMSKDDLLFKSLCNLSKVNLQEIETGTFGKNEYKTRRVYNANSFLKENPYFHYRRIAGKQFNEVLSIIRRWIRTVVGTDENGNTNDCLVVYDYFKIMNQKDLADMKEYEAMGYQISTLTDFAKEYDFSCMAFVQTNRQGSVSQSDRLLWNCHSLTFFERKTPEEIEEDGTENGNRKLRVTDKRYGPEPEGDSHINMHMDGSIATITEVNMSIDVERLKQEEENGFSDDGDSEEF